MKLKKALVVAGLAAGIAAISGIAAAQMQTQDAGFYLGAAVGQAKAKDVCTELTGVGFVGGCDDKDTAWKISAGYQFNKNFGVELGYVDLGEFTAAGTILGVPVTAKAEATGFEVLAVGTIPLAQQFSAYAKAGAFRWDVDTSATAAGVPVGVGDKGTDFTFGIGLKYDFTRNASARLEFQRYNNVGEDATTGQSDVNLWTLGVMYKF